MLSIHHSCRALVTAMALAIAAHGVDAVQRRRPAGTTAIDLYADGSRIHLLTADTDAKGTVLLHRASTDGGRTWSAAVPIEPSRDNMNAPSRNNDPQLAADDDRLTVVWSARGTSDWGAGPLDSAYSLDGGRTWTAGGRVNDDSSTGEHAFVDLTADTTGRAHAVWLDLRDGARGLRFAASDNQGRTWLTNGSIDTRTCECCWNVVATGWNDALLALYRDIPRDMALARSVDRGKTWTRIGSVGAFGWTVEVCPDVGGGVTRGATEGELHAMVWTGHESRRGLYVLSSRDNGVRWGEPVKVGPESAWHGDVAYGRSLLAVAWDANVARDMHVGWSYSLDAGRTWRDGGRLSTLGQRATHPKLAATQAGVVAVWTETDVEKGEIRWVSRLLSVPVTIAGR